MKAIVHSRFTWLLKREYWEERRGFLRAQIVVACTIVVLSLLGIIVFEVFRARNGISIGMNGSLTEVLQNALSKNQNGLVAGLDMTMLWFGGFASIVLFFVTFFYLLGALYEDRRDRSILFWKSLPISDTATVLSKVIAAIVLAPLIAVVMVLAGYLAEQVVVSIWLGAHGMNPFPLLWAHTGPISLWLHLLAMIPVNAAWALPTVGWLLFWSAAVRSKPFLWAVAIPIIAGVLNWWISLLGLPHIDIPFFIDNLVARPLLSVFPGSWISANPGSVAHFSNMVQPGSNFEAVSYGTMYGTFLAPQLWIGAIVGIALIAVAIWLRRWRSEA